MLQPGALADDMFPANALCQLEALCTDMRTALACVMHSSL